MGVYLIGIKSAYSDQSQMDRFIITDSRGNWGAPSPYLHDRRGPGYVLTSLVFDTLIWKSETGQFIPALARSWQQDGTEITFQLDPAAKWHDGQPVTADDVVFTFAYLRQHPYLSVDASVIGSVHALGKHTVRFELSHSFAPFLPNIAGTMPILPRHIFEKIDNPQRFSAPEAMIGSGPYRVKAYDWLQGTYLFEAVADYYRGTPLVRQIAFVKKSTPAAIAALKKGDVDLVTMIPPGRLDEVKAAGLTVVSYQMHHPVRLKFNTARPDLAQRDIRQGLAHLIDREQILKTVYLGEADLWQEADFVASLPAPSKGTPPPLPEPPVDLSHDPTRAQALLRANGWHQAGNGAWQTSDGTPVSLSLIAARHFDALARLIAGQLGAAGIPCTVTLFDRGGLDQHLIKGDYDLALVSFSMLGDPDIFRQAVIGTRIDSDRYSADPTLTSLLTSQAFETDEDQRRILILRAVRRYLAALPSYPMISPRRAVGLSPRLHLTFTPGGLGPGIPTVLNKQSFLPPSPITINTQAALP